MVSLSVLNMGLFSFIKDYICIKNISPYTYSVSISISMSICLSFYLPVCICASLTFVGCGVGSGPGIYNCHHLGPLSQSTYKFLKSAVPVKGVHLILSNIRALCNFKRQASQRELLWARASNARKSSRNMMTTHVP